MNNPRYSETLDEGVDKAAKQVINNANVLKDVTHDPVLEEAADKLAAHAAEAAEATTGETAKEAGTEVATLEEELQEASRLLREQAQDIGQSDTEPLIPATGQAANEVLKQAKKTEEAIAELAALARMKAARSVQLRDIVKVATGVWVGIMALFILIKRLVGFELLTGMFGGLIAGILGAAIYHIHRKLKAEQNSRIAMIPGNKGMQALLHQIPSWISFSDTEKMEWLNAILEKVWPFYDEAICAMVKQEVEPLFDQYKPPGVKKIYFQKLSFGDAPFRVEGIRIDQTSNDQILLESDFRWAGASSIFLAIQMQGGGSLTKMVPKVADMAVSGTARIMLKPLLPEIPGFGAATVSLMKTPTIKFHLDFGAAFGGSMSANAIRAWLDPFIRKQLASMLVWPNRLVVPILPPEITGTLQDLYQHHQGALQVDVIQAKNLPKMDTFGSADPLVEMYTQDKFIERTSVKKGARAPVWNERLWMLIQEPVTQSSNVTVYDVDLLNVTQLARVNVVKGAASMINAKEVIGRCSVKVSDYTPRPGEQVEKWYPLGLGAFDDPDGCGGGRGELLLKITYWPFDLMNWRPDAAFGAIVVTLIRCDDLPPADFPASADPYVIFECEGEPQKSTIKYNTLNPRWDPDQKFDWFRVPKGKNVKAVVMDWDRWSGDDKLCAVEIDIYKEVALHEYGDVTKTWALGDMEPEYEGKVAAGTAAPPSITLRVQWIPFK